MNSPAKPTVLSLFLVSLFGVGECDQKAFFAGRLGYCYGGATAEKMHPDRRHRTARISLRRKKAAHHWIELSVVKRSRQLRARPARHRHTRGVCRRRNFKLACVRCCREDKQRQDQRSPEHLELVIDFGPVEKNAGLLAVCIGIQKQRRNGDGVAG